jgi:hypothetical protein
MLEADFCYINLNIGSKKDGHGNSCRCSKTSSSFGILSQVNCTCFVLWAVDGASWAGPIGLSRSITIRIELLRDNIRIEFRDKINSVMIFA